MKNKSQNFSGWSDVTNGERNQLVFERLNKTYGAYEIRNNYDRTLLKALSTAVLLVVALAGLSFLSPRIKQIVIIPYTGGLVIDPPPIDPPVVPDIEPLIIPSGSPENANTNTPPIVTNDSIINQDTVTLFALNTDPSPGNSRDTNNSSIATPNINTGTAKTRQGSTLDTIFEFVTDRPEYPGGDEELFKFLRANTRIPQAITEIGQGINEKIGVVFIVERDGSITSASVLKGGCKYAELNNEAVRVINKMPKWEPGKQNGNKVKVRMILPFRFEVK